MTRRFRDRSYPFLRFSLIGFLSLVFSGCATLWLPSDYKGPEPRPAELLEYYSNEDSYTEFDQRPVKEGLRVKLTHILLKTAYGDIPIDYYSHEDGRDDLVLVFPMLGGRNELAKHFSMYLSAYGVDAAIIHRNNDFKHPQHFERFEELCRHEAIKSRIVVDFFEKEFGKQDFGTFGISRGAISASVAASIDERLKYNVFALGGSDIVGLFRESDERKIRRYVEKASISRGLSEEEFYFEFGRQIKTDPKYLAKHIDARDTLLILGLFDSAVPIKYGEQFRADMGYPETIYLPTGHRTTGLYTQYISLVPPSTTPGFGFFPFDYLESETLDFYREKFEHDRFDIKLMMMRVLQAPVNFIVNLFD